MSMFRSSTGNESKSATLGSVNRQNVIQEANRRRTLLQDNSWIKNRPEEEEEKIRDENYGKNVLSRYKSQDDLDRDTDKGDTKPIHNRFKSDDALDRISLKHTPERGNRSATLERVPKSDESDGKRQSWSPGNRTASTTTTTTTEENKRQSWAPSNRTSITTTETKRSSLPTKQEGQKITIYSSDERTSDKPVRSSLIDSARSRFEKSDDKPKLPPTSPTSPLPKTDLRFQNTEDKPKVVPRVSPAKTDEKPTYPTKPAVSQTGERRTVVERRQRSQDIDHLIDVTTTRTSSSKGDLNDLIEISSTTKNLRNRSQNLDDLIAIAGDGNKGSVGPTNNTTNIGSRSSTTTTKITENTSDVSGNRSTTNNTANIGSRSSTTTTKITENISDVSGNRSTTNNTANIGSRSSTATTKITENDVSGNRSTTSYKSTGDPRDATNLRSNKTTTTTTTTTTYNISEDKPDGTSRRTSSSSKVNDDPSLTSSRQTTTTYKSNNDTTNAPNQRSNVTITQESSHSPDITSFYYKPKLSYDNESAFRNSPVYDNLNAYEDTVKTSSIKTVYSTSDRSVIEKDMCTYCRKPLGIDAKMILKDLNISCHATCFKCEVCSGDLGGLKAGDSMWIYKQSIHCEPCYFKAKERWII
ncbi:sciellin isoform X1 [Pelobates cultripes]|uniref:Sciellin isoform X1 n=1 Tax=Pelobates cultripes TaxID=61616 RepID=A0AAD1VL97_PELCU|nr:sciellin isoform X1 [Pelobates cultripes]